MLYTGEFYDSHSGFYYNRARYYNPSVGRFNRLDPFAGANRDPQSLHKYLYAYANPINGMDPSGLIGTATATEVSITACIAAVLQSIAFTYLAFFAAADMILDPLEGRVWSWQYDYIGSRRAQLQARTAVRTAEQMAEAFGPPGLANSEIDDLPIFLVFRSVTPYIYENDRDAIASNPEWVALQYVGAGNENQRRQNHRDATRGMGHLRDYSNGLSSLDEYPFASTFQGGAGASVAAVPRMEQSKQGEHLRWFYEKMLRYQPRWFLVVTLPL